MLERKRLNKLVVATLQTLDSPPRAIELYETIKVEKPDILKEEKVRGFRSFVKIINQFSEVQHQGSMIKTYSLRRTSIIFK